MESFVLSAALAFVIYETVAFARPPRKNELNFQVGEIAITFTHNSAAWARRILKAILIVAILLVLLVLHELFLSIDAISRNRINIVFGLFGGPIFGIWLNSIVRHPPEKGLTKAQVITGIGLIFFFILGSVGNEAGKFIERYSRQISGFKIAGTELLFADKSRRDVTPGVASNAPAGTGGKSFTSSQGLQYVSKLNQWFIERDSQYITLFKASKSELDAQLENARHFAAEVVEQPFGCLFDWSQTAEDSTSIEDDLRAFAGVLRYTHNLEDDVLRSKFAAEFARQSRVLASEVGLVPALRESCLAFLRSASEADWIKKKDLDKLVANHEFEDRPYLAIAHASLMAQLGQYQSAGAILTNWLATKTKLLADRNVAVGNGNWPTSDDWFEIRARSVLAAFTEEWLQIDEASVATPLRNEHLRNLDTLRRRLEELLSKVSFFSELLKGRQAQGSFRALAPRACRFNDPQAMLWRRLFSSYISIELAYIQNTLVHPAYDVKFSESTTDSIIALGQMDLSCVVDDPKLIYAQVIEAYTRNAILYTYTRSKTESDDNKKNRIDAAIRASQVALELIKGLADADQARLNKPYVDRIAASDAIAVTEALAANGKRLEALKEE